MFGLSDQVLQLLRDYFSRRHEIIKVVIFGSRAMGKENLGSDIDLAIWTNLDSDLAGSVQIDLDELSTPYVFDVIDYKKITNVHLQEHIDRYGKLFYQRQTPQ